MTKTLLTLFLLTFGAATFSYGLGEQPMTSQERKFYAEQRQKAEARAAYYNRIDIIIGEATYPDDEFIHKMVRDNHQFAGEKLKECSLKAEGTAAELLATKTELARIKAILLGVGP